MDLIKESQKQYLKKNVPDLHSGDVIKVHQIVKEGKKTRMQIFEGIIIKTSAGKSLDGTFTVRRKSFGIGVEITFPLHSPAIAKIEKVKHLQVRRAKLYYLRQLTDKQIRRKGELKDFAVWEEEPSKEEAEKLRAEKEAAAKVKEEAKKKKQEELEKKFQQARGEIKVAPKEEKAKDDLSKKEPGN